LNEEIFRILLGIFDKNVEVTIFVEDACIQEFVLEVSTVACPVRLNQIEIWISGLWVFVEVLHVRVRRSAVDVEVELFNVLAMVRLAIRQTKRALLEDWIIAVPERHAEAQILLIVTDAGEAIFAAVIGARSSLVVCEVAPGVSAGAVVFANGTPLTFA
jgi:hypothetical protein